MKTSIYISGAISSNHALLSACQSHEAILTRERMFYAKEIFFPTKRAAKKALWQAYKHLRREEPEFSGIRYLASGILYYDASSAVIVPANGK